MLKSEDFERFKDFKIQLVESTADDKGFNVEVHELEISDIGYSDKVIKLNKVKKV